MYVGPDFYFNILTNMRQNMICSLYIRYLNIYENYLAQYNILRIIIIIEGSKKKIKA